MEKVFSKSIWIILIIQIIIISTVTSVNAQIDLPKIIKPSPETQALFRFQDYPMDYSTGLPQINVPIYEVSSGSLNVPISISYHASGSKVYDEDGPIALGWSLNAGGMISRIINGSADFGTATTGTYKFPYPFKYSTDLVDNNLANLQYFEKVMHFDKTEGEVGAGSYLDTEYDIFSYSFNNMAGKFIFKDENNVKTPILLPYKAYKITPTYTFTGLSKIEIIDDKGILYEFFPTETYSVSSQNATSGWALTKITSPDKMDIISFRYTSVSVERKTISQQAVLLDQFKTSDTYTNEPYPNSEPSYTGDITSTEYYYVSRLTEINFNQGKILFNSLNGSGKLDNIQVVNLDNKVLKTVQFNKSYSYTRSLGYATNKLDAIIFKDNTFNSVENYLFEYYPVVNTSQYVDVHFCDWWGYYNNSGVHDFVPYFTNVPYYGYQGIPSSKTVGNPLANREPNLEALKNGVLKKITYPTSGTTEFIYENNKCTLNGLQGTAQIGPGLRIYQIKSMEGVGAAKIKTYKYGKNESGYGAIEMLPEMTTMTREEIFNFLGPWPFGPGPYDPNRSANYSQRTFYSGFLPELEAIAARPVIYSEVVEYNGTEEDNIGKSIYKYDENYAKWGYQPMRVFEQLFLFPKHIYEYNYWNNPSLILKTDYKRTGNAGSIIYLKKKETINTFSVTTTDNVKGLHVQHQHVLPQKGKDNITLQYAERYATFNNVLLSIPPLRIYTYSDYIIPVGYKYLKNSDEIIYNDDGSLISNNVAYEYNSHQFLNKTTHKVSDLSLLVTDIKYPFDYNGIPVLDQMVNLNMLNYKVEQIESKNTTPLSGVKTNYFDWGTGTPMIAPQTIETKKGSNSYETRMRYYGYDIKGNPLSVSKEHDVVKSYIWGYNNTYPVAEVAGITYSSAIGVLNQTVIQNPPSDQILRDEVNKIKQSYPSAFVTNYTYKPLIGMTSQTDVNDRTIYYQYDAFGRLIIIRDKDNNIVKKICYNYLGQPGECTIFANQVQTGIFTKNNCVYGTVGSQVTYTVPINTYYASKQATADASAINDVTANGQNYANANGTCTAPQITVSGYNYVSTAFYVRFTNTVTGYTVSMSLYPNSSSSVQLPAGSYNINFYQYGSSTYTYFSINGYSTYGNTANFYNVNIGSYSYVQVG